jgi:hypothetical protein
VTSRLDPRLLALVGVKLRDTPDGTVWLIAPRVPEPQAASDCVDIDAAVGSSGPGGHGLYVSRRSSPH